MNKKKIIFCANNLCFGGIEVSLINLLKKLNYEKYDIFLMLEKKEGELLKDVPSNVNIKEFKVFNNKVILIRKFLNFMNQFFWKIKYKNKFDYSICYATYSLADNKIARISSKNAYLYIHSNYTLIYNVKNLMEFFNKRNLDEFKKIIFVSNESRKDLLKYYPSIKDKSIVINNIIDKEKIINNSKAIIPKYNKNNINLLFVGRLEEASKNIMLQLEAINILKEEINNIRLYIIGDGPDKQIYEDYIKKNHLQEFILMLGYKANPYPYIKYADYIILTSKYEGFPVIFNEALVLNKTPLSTLKISDDVIDIGNNYGILISFDKNILSKELKRIIKNKEQNIMKINIDDINNKRLEKIEELFNE